MDFYKNILQSIGSSHAISSFTPHLQINIEKNRLRSLFKFRAIDIHLHIFFITTISFNLSTVWNIPPNGTKNINFQFPYVLPMIARYAPAIMVACYMCMYARDFAYGKRSLSMNTSPELSFL